MSKKAVIVGGGAAGTACAFELRKLDKDIRIMIIEKSGNLEYSPCALPYVLAGEIKSFDDIFIFKKTDYENNGIDIKLHTAVQKIDREAKKLICEGPQGAEEVFYDDLVLATGSSTSAPKIKGMEGLEYYTLKTIGDAKKISDKMKTEGVSVIIGAGLVGLELAAAIKKQGGQTLVLEAKDRPLSGLLDKDMSRQLLDHLAGLGIELKFNASLTEIKDRQIYSNEEKPLLFDRLYFCAGMKADTGLAEASGLECGEAIITNNFLQASDENIYACGDCIFSTEINTNKKMSAKLGTIAVRQGKIVARNILGQKTEDLPITNNTITKIGDLFIGSVGLSTERAVDEGMDVLSAAYTGPVRSEYYPSSGRISVKIIANKKGKVIGGQIIGREEVVGRLNLLSLAIQKGMFLEDLINMESCYNPASAPINEAVSVAAEICYKKLEMLSNE